VFIRARYVALAAFLLLASALAFACASDPPKPSSGAPAVASNAWSQGGGARPAVRVQILAINDFHGNLEPPRGSSGEVTASLDDPVTALPGSIVHRNEGRATAQVQAGGAAYLATHIKQLARENPNTVVVSAGDLTGASPLLSNVFHDEPTVLFMNQLPLDIEGVGNHDLDRGLDELYRLQRGGCSMGDCDAGTFAGATFTYLAANVRSLATHETVFPPYAIKEFSGAKIAFIGLTLKGTPTVTLPSAIKGLVFEDEATTVNALVPELEKQNVSAIVVLLHQGAFPAAMATYDACEGLTGDLLPILHGDPDAGLPGLSSAVDVVVTGHTHQAYNCVIDGRIVTSASSYGRCVTKIDLLIDPAAKRVLDKHARNIVVTHDVAPDPEALGVIAAYKEKARPVMGRVIGYLSADLIGDAKAIGSASCETPLGDLVADAQWAATRDTAHGHADLAFMNDGGMRADLTARVPGKPDFAITYAEAFDVQPFANQLVTMTLSGAQILTLLDAQFGRDRPHVLQASSGFGYAYTYNPETKTAAIDRKSIRVHGALLDPAKPYRVTVNAFLAAGGDAFAAFKEGTDRVTGQSDLEALVAYLGSVSSASKPLATKGAQARIRGDGCR
jgi:5'-nucleotidase